jgi:hypothetical protein
MIKIITIDRDGSGAADIAATLAARLGWKLWDELLTIEIARRLEVATARSWSSVRSAATPCLTGSSRRSCPAASKAH